MSDEIMVTICHIGRGLTEGPMPWRAARDLCAKLDEIKSPYRITVVASDSLEPAGVTK